MRSQTHSFLVPPVVGTPRGVLAAEHWLTAGSAVLRKLLVVPGLTLWRDLEAQGQRRAQRELSRAALQCERTAPERSALLRQAAASLANPAVAPSAAQSLGASGMPAAGVVA